MKVVSIVAAGMFVAALVGCATTETQPWASVTSLAPNAQQWFRISWTAEPDRNGGRRPSGHAESTLGGTVERVPVLSQAPGAHRNRIRERLGGGPEVIAALGRAGVGIP